MKIKAGKGKEVGRGEDQEEDKLTQKNELENKEDEEIGKDGARGEQWRKR